MKDSQYLFQYLNNVWELFPEKDKKRFGESWKAYEQTYGDVWAKLFDRNLGNSIDHLPLYNIQRWMVYMFDESTAIERAAKFRSVQDLSSGINLSSRYLIKMSVDGGPATEIDLRGAVPLSTTITEIISKVNAAMGAPVAAAVVNNQLVEYTSPTVGPTSSLSFYPASDPTKDASALVLGLDPDVELPKTVPMYPYEFQLPDRFIVGMPELVDTIHEYDDTIKLIQTTDYTVEFGSGIISFVNPPPEKMWAPDTLVNREVAYNNFGFLMDIYDSNTPSYLKAVKGLWYAFWTGPRPENIRRSLYLLFGLPTASQDGVVTKVTSTQITLLYPDTTIEVFEIPAELTALVMEGQSVTRFQPLVSGIRVYDKINYPGFMTKEGGRASVAPFLTEKATTGDGPDTDETKALRILEENTYLPQIDVNSFISPDIKLSNVQIFLKNIQPKSRQYLFQVLVGTFRDKLTILDEGYTSNVSPSWPNGMPSLGLGISFDVTANVDWNNNIDTEQTNREDAESNYYTYLTLDSHVFTQGDRVNIEVYQGMLLVDSFDLEG